MTAVARRLHGCEDGMPQAGNKRKPCEKQIQNGSVFDLFAAVNGRRKSFLRKLHRSEKKRKLCKALVE